MALVKGFRAADTEVPGPVSGTAGAPWRGAGGAVSREVRRPTATELKLSGPRNGLVHPSLVLHLKEQSGLEHHLGSSGAAIVKVTVDVGCLRKRQLVRHEEGRLRLAQ